MQIPGPEPRADGGVGAIARAGGLHDYQLWLHAEYGPVVRFQLPGAETAVSIADPVLLEAVAHLDERPPGLFSFLDPLFEAGNLQVLPAGEHGPWRRLLLTVLAGRPSHERHFARFTALATGLADRWAALPAGQSVELQRELTGLSLRMICGYALDGGTDDPDGGIEDPEGVVEAFEAVLTDQLERLYRVPSERPPEQRAERAARALARLRATVDRVIAAHHRGHPGGRSGGDGSGGGGSGGDRSDLIGALVEAGESPARIRDTVLAVMLAAHHTTGVAVSWTLHLLAAHPAAAARVTEELDRVLGDRPVPDHADLRRLPYLGMVLRESLRRYPPGPYGARLTTGPLAVGGYVVPTGAVVFLPIRAVHLNPAYWPEPERFRPERFTPEESAGRPRLAWIPFGLGPRACEGEGLAVVEAQVLLAVLLKRLRFRPEPGHRVVPVERFVLWAADDIRMLVEPRAAAGEPAR
ncbi:cytochrome P450 [Kitasatospora sp. NPDC058184]|uniref:cytochrome P450 n=1 Tax=Kitasatospora sp. NPDC058184 TaxID=3346370 RepID=UPI0036DED4C3